MTARYTPADQARDATTSQLIALRERIHARLNEYDRMGIGHPDGQDHVRLQVIKTELDRRAQALLEDTAVLDVVAERLHEEITR